MTTITPNYFSNQQKIQHEKLPSNLREDVDHLLNSENPNDVRVGRHIIAISDKISTELKDKTDVFFKQLLKNSEEKLLDPLKKLTNICERGWSKSFFSCVNTKAVCYYSPDTLRKIIDLFDAVTSLNPSANPLDTFPFFDEGGLEYLEQIRANPSLLTNGELSPSNLNAAPPPLLKDLISKNDLCFQKVKSAAIKYLTSLNSSFRSSMDVYVKIFNCIEENPNNTISIALIKLIIIASTRKIAFSELELFLDEAHNIQMNLGEEILLSLCNAHIFEKDQDLDSIIQSFRALNLVASNFELAYDINQILKELSSGKINLSNFKKKIELISPKSTHPISQQTELDLLFERFKGKDPNVLFPLPENHLNTIKKQYELIQSYCRDWMNLEMNQLIKMAIGISEKSNLAEDDMLELIAIGRLLIYQEYHLYLHHTQVLTVLAQLLYDKGAIAQVKTGEGKSMIICLLSFVLAMQKQSVHIISSSHSLATRDQVRFFPFFKKLGIKTSHICDPQPEAKSFKASILYGTATDFEFAIMREMLYFNPLFEQSLTKEKIKRFDAVIIDEIDNLTIDTASNSARLSIPAENSFSWIYIHIFKFAKEHFSDDQKDPTLNNQTFESLRKYLMERINSEKRKILSQITNEQLRTWLLFAHSSLFSKKDQIHYVVQRKKNDESEIVIVDSKNTGDLMNGMRWEKGLHEFTEVKHGIIPEAETLVPLSLSHAVFYQMYRNIYGLTGTLGSAQEREELKEIYDLACFDIPTYHPPLRIDEPIKIVNSNKILLSNVLKTIFKCRAKGRPILVICPTIKDSNEIKSLLDQNSIPLEILNGVQEKSEDKVLEKAGLPGSVTIATNTAGRGTDIKLSQNSIKNGGLHVLLTFQPDSVRVEEQARGRAGRQGEPGSSEIVVSLERLNLSTSYNVDNSETHDAIVTFLKKQRETSICMTKRMHLCHAAIERYSFSLTSDFYNTLSDFNKLMNNGCFLKDRAIALSDSKLIAAKTVTGSDEEEQLFSEIALELLTNNSNNPIPDLAPNLSPFLVRGSC